MAKKDNKKGKVSKPAAKKSAKPAAKKVAKPAKKAAKPVAKKPAKPAAKKPAKPVAKKEIKKVSKPVKATAKKPAKPVAKASVKKVEKPVAKKTEKKPAAKPVAKELKKVTGKIPAGKPIDAIKKKGKPENKSKKTSKKQKGGDDSDEEEGEDVEDEYEKPEEDDTIVGELDEAGLVDLDGGGDVPDLDDDDEEEPIKRGRGRRKKNEGKSSGSSMESYIRNRPLQIDLSKPLIKKTNENSPKPFVNTKDNRTRYSDKELAEFKELILVKLKEAQTDYELLKQTLSNEDNHGTDDTSPTFKLLEDGSDVMSKEETAQLAARQEKYIINLKNALVRIENKSYGICRVTGKLIPKERLRSVPHATLSIDAKLNQNN
jgi:DnaK suppressor protein